MQEKKKKKKKKKKEKKNQCTEQQNKNFERKFYVNQNVQLGPKRYFLFPIQSLNHFFLTIPTIQFFVKDFFFF